MRTRNVLITVLLLGAPVWVAGQAARPATGAPEIFSGTAQAKSATGAVSGTLEVRLRRYTPDFDRKTVEAALREGGYPRFVTDSSQRARGRDSSCSAAASRSRSGMRAKRSRPAAAQSWW